MNLIYSLLSGLVGASIVSVLQGYFVRVQTKAAEKMHAELLDRMLDERVLLNQRLGQISSNTGNIAFYLSGRRLESDEARPLALVIADYLNR